MTTPENNSALIAEKPSPRRLHFRMRTLSFGLGALFVVVCGRLLQVQIIDASHYRKLADKQYQKRIILPAVRGSLYDRNGHVLASNSMSVSFAADPVLAADEVSSIAGTFARVFGKPTEHYLQKFSSESRFAWLERQVNIEYIARIRPDTFSGLVVRYEPKRLYHNDYVAGQLIGSTNVDYVGTAGVEWEFNKELSGTDGYVVFQRDGFGHARPAVDYPRVEPVNGHDIYLTIDLTVQSIAEEELKKGVEANNADAGTIVVLQPTTGEILAIAQYPSVNPNAFSHSEPKDQRLRAVTDVFEPGSVFKLVTASAALDAGLVKPTQKFYAEQGVYTVPLGNGKVRNIKDVHPYGWITFQQAMEVSSNIVMAKVSDILGSERLYKMARNYGFGMLTEIELPGEVKGALKKPMDWSSTTLNTMAYGYEVGVTPLQLAVAYAAAANGGMLMKPFIVKKETDAGGQVVRESVPQAIRRAISPSTAQTLREFFVGVVERGTAKPARIPGLNIGGKTGTSRKYVEGGYEPKNYTASFVGFFPSDSAQLLCLVMLDNPRGANYTGGTTSAPIFRAIAERVLTTTQWLTPIGTNMYANDMRHQSSTAGAKDTSQQTTERAPVKSRTSRSDTLVPDVRGFSARRAVSLLTMEQFEPIVNGSGIVVQQQPQAGASSRSRAKVILTCQPKSAAKGTKN